MEDYLERLLKSHFQCHFEFELDSKTYKKGQMALFRIDTRNNNYDIAWMFKREDRIETFRIPFPFKVEYYPEEGEMFFDYRLRTLVKGNQKAETKLRTLSNNYTPSKYFDQILTIRFK